MARSRRFLRAMRMRSESHFRRAWSRGARAKGPWLLVVVHPNDGGLPRLGLSVSKRALRGAVDRNRVRRLLREAFRLECAALPAGFDMILAPSAAARGQPLTAFRSELQRLAWAACRRFRAPSSEGQALGSPPPRPSDPRPPNGT